MKVVLQNLTKIFPSRDKKSGKEVVAVNDFTFEIPDGKLIGLLGPSGCGKSTTLNLLCGLLKPSSGKIFFGEDDVTDLPAENRGVGLVFQNYALFENMTVLQNVEYALKIRKENKSAEAKKAVRERALQMLANLGLSEHANKMPTMLSGGQQQRVAIARTMVLNPDIILFDAPMSALDVDTRLSLRAELKRIQKEFGTTMIYITHDQEEAFAMSDRIMIMREANVVQLDTPDNIVDHPADDYVKNFVLRNLQIKIDSLLKCVRG